jgi:hypothetical protein
MTKREVQQAKSLAKFDSYGPASQLLALSFFAPYWEKVAQPLRDFYSDVHLQERLGFLLWKHARQHVGLDYSGSELSAQERSDLKTLNKALPAVYDVFQRIVNQDFQEVVGQSGMDNLARMLFRSGLTGPVLYDLLDCFDTFLSMSGQWKTKLGRPKKHLALEKLMTEIAKLYERATGELAVDVVQSREADDTFTGDFFKLARLVENVAAAATGRRRLSDIALGRVLERALPSEGLLQRGPPPQWIFRLRTAAEDRRDTARNTVLHDPRYVLAHKHLYKKS